MMNSTAYSFKVKSLRGLSFHGLSNVRTFFADYDDTTDYEEYDFGGSTYYSNLSKEEKETIELHVRSGDYFVTLATKLDNLNQSVGNNVVAKNIQKIVDELLYLQDKHHLN